MFDRKDICSRSSHEATATNVDRNNSAGPASVFTVSSEGLVSGCFKT